MISYVIPTKDRASRLRQTLMMLDALGPHPGGAEVVIADNDSRERLVLPRLGMPVREVRLRENLGAAARNTAARAADPASEWLVMLDDDSYPDHTGYVARLAAMPTDVAAVSADIRLARGRNGRRDRESGGLPEVFIGCGVAIRRSVFLELGGYDPSFGYYAEEYDLAARILARGMRIVFDPGFGVTHAKDATNRSMDVILGRLVRNNGYVAQRYAPEALRLDEIRRTRSRYRAIAEKEGAIGGYAGGLAELRATIRGQARTPLTMDLWDRFTGLAYARRALGAAHTLRAFASAAVVDPGKNAWAVVRALEELGVKIAGEGEDAEVEVIGTLSPGPMLDAYERRAVHRYPGAPRVLTPWTPAPVAARPVHQPGSERFPPVAA